MKRKRVILAQVGLVLVIILALGATVLPVIVEGVGPTIAPTTTQRAL